MKCIKCGSKNVEPIAGKVYKCKEEKCGAVWAYD